MALPHRDDPPAADACRLGGVPRAGGRIKNSVSLSLVELRGAIAGSGGEHQVGENGASWQLRPRLAPDEQR